ncbi:MAG TPA: argininosuccinate lyase, partial [Gemmatimonadaceae bacterium]|nr:argininosuccinate lyase [Gemmatimonadaceae bacterium]
MTTTAFVEAAAKAHKLWGGRFSGAGTAPQFDALNNSIGVDIRLWPFDVELSKAWAMALYGAGVLTIVECKEIERGLDSVAKRLEGGAQPIESDEDVHTFIDRLLHDEV